jgi:hypothetical protein
MQIDQIDRFALFMALLIHHLSGGKIEELDVSNYPALALRVYRKAVVVHEKRFPGNSSEFNLLLLMRVAIAKVENDFEMLAVEQWLDVELREAGHHPREFN